MSPIQYIILDGTYLKTGDPLPDSGYSGLPKGEILSESMHASGTQIQFLEEHMDRLNRNMSFLNFEIPDGIQTDSIRNQVRNLLNKNRLFQGAEVILSIYRSIPAEGTYDHPVSYSIRTRKLEFSRYRLNKKGLVIDVFPKGRKFSHPLSNLKNANSLFYHFADDYRLKMDLDECIILNERDLVTEGIFGNIFVVRGKTLYTPSLDSGCIEGIIREYIVNLSVSLHFIIFEEAMLHLDDLLSADEIFYANEVTGIRWAGAFRNRRYYNKVTRELFEQLNEHAFQY